MFYTLPEEIAQHFHVISLLLCLATLFRGNGVGSLTNYFVGIGTWATV
jgi:hypothetical protein